MQFDIIIGNPPYQQSDGGHAASAMPVYHHFVQQAKRLNPRFISLIIPARWYSGGKGLDSFREEMINDEHIRVLHDYPNSKNCFPNVQIEGGVCYFLRNRDEAGECRIITHIDGENWDSKRMLRSPYVDTFIRYPEQLSVVEKVWKGSTAETFASLVSSRKPFGLATDLFKEPKKYGLPPVSVTKIDGGYTIYGLGEKMQRAERYVAADYPLPNKNRDIDKWKVFVPKALGTSKENSQDKVLGDSFVGSPKSLCTETYLSVGSFLTLSEAENCLSYIKTKFLRFLVGIIKMTQNTTRRVYHLVPMQDFGESWTDAKLYTKYNLTDSEIAFIEKMIREMP